MVQTRGEPFSLQQLLNQLNSRKPDVRDAALRTARALPPDELLQLVVLEARNRRIRFWQSQIIYGLVCFWVITLGSLLHIPRGGWYGMFQAVGMMLGSMSSMFYARWTDDARSQLSVLMSQAEDVRFVAPMLRLGHTLPSKEAEVLQTALIRLLPQIRASDAPNWSKEDKATLLLPFKSLNNPKDLITGCFKALEQIGDASAIPAVKKLAERAFQDNRKDVWQAAQDCLLYLQSNTGRFQQAETLLRSSDVTTARSDTLLRPAASTSDTVPAEQLLRPKE